MRVSFTRLLIATVVLTGSANGVAYAQETIVARVPFEFQVGGQTFEPGRYVVTLNGAAAGVASVRSEQGNSFAFTLTFPAEGHNPAHGTPTLVFNKDEHRYTLRQIWESDSEGYRISR